VGCGLRGRVAVAAVGGMSRVKGMQTLSYALTVGTSSAAQRPAERCCYIYAVLFTIVALGSTPLLMLTVLPAVTFFLVRSQSLLPALSLPTHKRAPR
jgi:hypothetical protein